METGNGGTFGCHYAGHRDAGNLAGRHHHMDAQLCVGNLRAGQLVLHSERCAFADFFDYMSGTYIHIESEVDPKRVGLCGRCFWGRFLWRAAAGPFALLPGGAVDFSGGTNHRMYVWGERDSGEYDSAIL